MADFERLDYSSPDGSQWGDSGAKLGMYGVTPVTRGVATAVTALATTVFSEAKTGMWGFGSSTAAQLFRTRINQLIADMAKLKLTGILS